MFEKMKALLDMQKKMQQVKQELQDTVFEVASSDGLVKITMNGSQEIKDISIQPGSAPGSCEGIERAVKDALNRAIRHSHDIAAAKMKQVTGLNLPGLP